MPMTKLCFRSRLKFNIPAQCTPSWPVGSRLNLIYYTRRETNKLFGESSSLNHSSGSKSFDKLGHGPRVAPLLAYSSMLIITASGYSHTPTVMVAADGHHLRFGLNRGGPACMTANGPPPPLAVSLRPPATDGTTVSAGGRRTSPRGRRRPSGALLSRSCRRSGRRLLIYSRCRVGV